MVYRILRIITHAGPIVPGIVLIIQYVLGNLGANPIQVVQLITGNIALNLLMLSLLCTPVYILSHYKPVLLVRKPLGLYALGYASFHLINFVGIDYGFDFTLIRDDALIKKPYIIVGLVALVLLIPLAVTSARRWIKVLGKNWFKLHWLIYPAAIFDVIHFIWQTKAVITLPLIYSGILFFLLGIRLPPVRKIFDHATLDNKK